MVVKRNTQEVEEVTTIEATGSLPNSWQEHSFLESLDNLANFDTQYNVKSLTFIISDQAWLQDQSNITGGHVAPGDTPRGFDQPCPAYSPQFIVDELLKWRDCG